MDIESARAELTRALGATGQAGPRFRAAQDVLVRHGIEAFGIMPRQGLSLDEVVAIAAAAPRTETRRAFAVLLVHAFAIAGLLPPRGETEQRIRSFLELALLNPLRRANYPFDGTAYDKRQVLARLHATIDEHLRLPEPSIPRWLHGGRPADSD